MRIHRFGVSMPHRPLSRHPVLPLSHISVFPSFHFSIFPSYCILPALVLFVLFTPAMMQAQQGMFIPERPGQTWSTEVTAPGYVHFEAGLMMERASFTPDGVDGSLEGGEVYRHTVLQLPAMMLRIGVGDHVEFRLSSKYVRLSWRFDPEFFDPSKTGQPLVENSNSGMDVVSAGIKTSLTREKGWLPASALIASVAIPSTSSAVYAISQPAPDLALSFSHTLGKDLYLGYCAGLSWDGWTAYPLGYASTMLTFALDEKMDMFIEYSLQANTGTPVLHSADAGLVYTVNEDLKIDAWGGFGIGQPESSSPSPHYSSIYHSDIFVGVGAAYRIQLGGH